MTKDLSTRLGITSTEQTHTESVIDLILGKQTGTARREIVTLPLDQVHPLHTFEHPFEKSLMLGIDELMENIKLNGVLQPILVWPDPEQPGSYEILAGHRRRVASLKAGLKTIPAEIRQCDPSMARLIVTETNTGAREKIFRSELAKAYKMQLEALKQQGKRRDWTELIEKNIWHPIPQANKAPAKARDIVAMANGTSPRRIAEYVRLNYLIGPLADWCDEEKLFVKAAVQLSYLKQAEQQLVYEICQQNNVVISIEMAAALKNQSEEGLNRKKAHSILVHSNDKRKPAYDEILRSLKKRCFKGLNSAQLDLIHSRKDDLEKTLFDAIGEWLKENE